MCVLSGDSPFHMSPRPAAVLRQGDKLSGMFSSLRRSLSAMRVARTTMASPSLGSSSSAGAGRGDGSGLFASLDRSHKLQFGDSSVVSETQGGEWWQLGCHGNARRRCDLVVESGRSLLTSLAGGGHGKCAVMMWHGL